MEKKQLWIINHYATPPSDGGLNRHHYFAKYLTNHDIKATIVAASAIHNSNKNYVNNESRTLFKSKKIDGVNYLHIKTRQYKNNKVGRVINMLQFYFRAKKVLKKINPPSYIYASSPSPLSVLIALRMAKKTRVQCIVEVRDLWPETLVSFGMFSRKSLFAKALYKLEQYIYTKANKIVFTMEGGLEYILQQSYAKKIDIQKVYHLNNGVDLSEYKQNFDLYKLEDEDLNNKKSFKIIYTGSIRFSYDIGKIIQLAKHFKEKKIYNIKFLLYGTGPNLNEFRNIVVSENLDNIVFKGFINVKYIPFILSKADIALLHGKVESVFKYGTSQNKLFTYMAAGKPIVSTFKNKYDLISKNKLGLTVDSSSIQSYSDGILQIYNSDNNVRRNYIKNNLKTVKQYDYKDLTKNLVKILED